MNSLTRLIQVINALSSQVYAFGAMLVGCLLLAMHFSFGEAVVVGGFALLQGNKPTSPTPDKVI